jgi:hypothetical protein
VDGFGKWQKTGKKQAKNKKAVENATRGGLGGCGG